MSDLSFIFRFPDQRGNAIERRIIIRESIITPGAVSISLAQNQGVAAIGNVISIEDAKTLGHAILQVAYALEKKTDTSE